MSNPSHKFMEKNLSKVINQVPLRGIEVASYLKICHQFKRCFQAFQETLYLKEIFQSVCLTFLDALDYI